MRIHIYTKYIQTYNVTLIDNERRHRSKDLHIDSISNLFPLSHLDKYAYVKVNMGNILISKILYCHFGAEYVNTSDCEISLE